MKKNSNYVHLLLIGIFLLLQIPLIDTIPGIMVDEPWYANTAWNFSIGNGFTNTVPGAYGGDDLFLFTFLLGVAFKLFGTSLLIARTVSVIGGVIGLIGFFQVLKLLKIRSKSIVFICGLLFIFSNVNYIIFRSVRPESWVVALVVWALYFLIKGSRTNKEVNYLFCGLLSSTVFLCHPHGALYILLFGIIVLLYCYNNKNFKTLTYYILGILPIAVIFFLYIFAVRQETLLEFFGSWSSRIATEQESFIPSQISNLNTFFRTYTLGLKRLFIFIFEVGVLLYGLFFYKKNKYVYMLSIIGLTYFLFALVFLSPFSTRHFGEILIFSFITFALLLDYNKNNIFKYKFLLTAGFLYLGNNFAGDIYIIWHDRDRTPYSHIEKRIDKIVPENTKVLTLLNFWFPLKNNENYNDYTRWKLTDYMGLDSFLESGHGDYVVISDYMVKGITSTSGRIISGSKRNAKEKYYDKVHHYAEENGKILETILTNGYGEIEIWKLK